MSVEARIADVEVTDDLITARLLDGRVISVPLAWSWRLSDATAAERANWKLIGGGNGVHWPDVDEDISAEGMLMGTPAPRPRRRTRAEVAGSGRRSAGQRSGSEAKPKTRSRAARD